MVRARLAAPRGFEPRLTDPKSAVLPLDEGAEDRSLGRHGPGRQHAGSGAEDGTRTRDPHLGKVMLYQLSHFRSKNRASPIVWCREPGSNWRHRDFQSRALPTELSRPVQLTDWLPVGAGKGTTSKRTAARQRKTIEGASGTATDSSAPYSSPLREPVWAGSMGASPVSWRNLLMRSAIGG